MKRVKTQPRWKPKPRGKKKLPKKELKRRLEAWLQREEENHQPVEYPEDY